MSSICVSKCVNDARVPSSANYVSLRKLPESCDGKFSGNRRRTHSCKPMHITANSSGGRRRIRPFRLAQYQRRRRKAKKVVLVKKMKEFSCEAFCLIFKKLLSCTATVDVVEQAKKSNRSSQNN